MPSVHLEKEKGSHTSRSSMHVTSCPSNCHSNVQVNTSTSHAVINIQYLTGFTCTNAHVATHGSNFLTFTRLSFPEMQKLLRQRMPYCTLP